MGIHLGSSKGVCLAAVLSDFKSLYVIIFGGKDQPESEGSRDAGPGIKSPPGVEAVQKRIARGSAMLQLERIYQARIALMSAQLSACQTESKVHEATVNCLLLKCSMFEQEVAKLKRDVRRLSSGGR
jgi:hypothetical protein